MVATGTANYQVVPQEDSTQPDAGWPPSPSSPIPPIQPSIYFGEGPFSPPSSSEGSYADEKPRSRAFLDDEGDDVPSSPTFTESGVRRREPVSIHSHSLV